jgi:hypothetical protein
VTVEANEETSADTVKRRERIRNDNSTDNAQAYGQPGPNPDLRSLGERLVGMWEVSDDVQGTVTYGRGI